MTPVEPVRTFERRARATVLETSPKSKITVGADGRAKAVVSSSVQNSRNSPRVRSSPDGLSTVRMLRKRRDPAAATLLSVHLYVRVGASYRPTWSSGSRVSHSSG